MQNEIEQFSNKVEAGEVVQKEDLKYNMKDTTPSYLTTPAGFDDTQPVSFANIAENNEQNHSKHDDLSQGIDLASKCQSEPNTPERI